MPVALIRKPWTDTGDPEPGMYALDHASVRAYAYMFTMDFSQDRPDLTRAEAITAQQAWDAHVAPTAPEGATPYLQSHYP